MMSPQPVVSLILAKIFAHWLVTGLPLILLESSARRHAVLADRTDSLLMLSLLLGTPVLSLIGAVGAALIVGLRAGGVLLSLLVLPLHSGADLRNRGDGSCSGSDAV